MVVAVVAIGCATAVAIRWFKSQSEAAGADQTPRIDKLEARVQALEDAVSDPEHQLREQFRELESG